MGYIASTDVERRINVPQAVWRIIFSAYLAARVTILTYILSSVFESVVYLNDHIIFPNII